jgi:hypothetical protein
LKIAVLRLSRKQDELTAASPDGKRYLNRSDHSRSLIISRNKPIQARSTFSSRDCQPDTNSSSAFWQSAPVIFLTRNVYGEPLLGPGTEVRSRWTLTHLYLLFACPYDTLYLKPNPVTLTETNKLWEWDVAEVFVGSDFNNIRRYKEFEVSPQGEWVDVDVDLDSPHHEEGWVWTSGIEVAARIDHHRCIWYGSMRIPFTAIDSRPTAAGNLLRINFFRCYGSQRASLAWSPTRKPTFHVPEVFGTLVLEEG